MKSKKQVEELYQQHHQKIYGYFLQRLRSREDALDACQETFFRLLRQPRLPSCGLTAYMWKSAKNLAREIYRKKTPPLENDTDDIAWSGQGPEKQLVSSEEIREIARAINELSPRCREVFILHRFKNLSHKEIAQQLGLTPKTVENHMVNALVCLRGKLM